MILCHDDKAAFISTPRSGTHTMYAILERDYGGLRYGDFHQRQGPSYCVDWFIFTTVRNPFPRAVSAWQWGSVLSDNKEEICAEVGGEDLLSFVEHMARGAKRWVPFYSQSAWLRYVRLNAALHIERINEEVQTLPFWRGPETLPCLCRSPRKPWREYTTPPVVDAIRRWAAEDFERFGYIDDPDVLDPCLRA